MGTLPTPFESVFEMFGQEMEELRRKVRFERRMAKKKKKGKGKGYGC